MTKVSMARWVELSLGPEFGQVSGVIPRGFDAYVRLFHPARSKSGDPVRWADIAAWSGRAVHPLMAFEGISVSRHENRVDPPWVDDPQIGTLDLEDAAPLSEFLAGFTTTPARCFFAVWDGYGQFTPGASAILTRSGRGISQSPPAEVVKAERLTGVSRDYVLYSGSISAISGFFVDHWTHLANIWWPMDRAWCVATDIDMDSTYVGGSKDCIEALIENRKFEALPTTLGASTYVTADEVNVR